MHGKLYLSSLTRRRINLIVFMREGINQFFNIFKRVFDTFFALLLLISLFSFLVLIMVIIMLDSPGPIFYRGVRVGKNGKTFRIWKFRTMIADAELKGGPSTALNDSRITSVGRFLRKYKLDEIPQLINILTGEMSFVGPRPQVERYTKLYSGEEKLILTVKPGLTDYASLQYINLDQILGDGDVDEKYLKEIEPEKNKLRIKYVKEQSLLTDMKILYLTAIRFLKIRSIWNTSSLD